VDSFPSILNVKQEEIDTIEKRGAYSITIIGCEREGVALGIAFAEAGFKTTLADPDQSLIKRLTKEYKFPRRLVATSDLRNAVSQSDAVIITTRPRIDDKKNVDCTEAEKFLKEVGMTMRQGTVIVYTGIASLGFMENTARETLTNASGMKMGEGFGLAYSPIQVAPSDHPDQIANLDLIVAANDKPSLDSASTLLGTITKRKPRQTMNFKTAELARLFSSARKDTNLALANELATLCENINIDYLETLRILDFEAPTALPIPAIAAEWASEVRILLDNAENLGTKLRFAGLARQINEDMVRHAVNLTQNALRNCGRTLTRAKIALFGPIASGTLGEKYAKSLEAKGARITSLDPLAKSMEHSGRSEKPNKNLTDLAEGADCIVFLEKQEPLTNINLRNLKTVMRSPSAIVDLAGAFEPEKIETEGFIYRGLGRRKRAA
jgi:UDP-N-acetyl-D-mannosaminuronic acid dehydrogenase